MHMRHHPTMPSERFQPTVLVHNRLLAVPVDLLRRVQVGKVIGSLAYFSIGFGENISHWMKKNNSIAYLFKKNQVRLIWLTFRKKPAILPKSFHLRFKARLALQVHLKTQSR